MMDFEAAEQLFVACDKDRDGYISRQDLQSLCLELQLEESVDDLLQQLGADDKGLVSYAQFLLCHKNLQLTSNLYDIDATSTMQEETNDKVCRRREPKNGSSGGRLRNARHWDWLGQALEAGFLRGQLDKSGATSKEQLLIERRQKLQGKTEPQEGQDGEDKQIVALSQRLAQVTAERDQLKHQHGDDDHDQDWETQCQRYEERIVELHSVIAELSRKLDVGKNDVIPEESEVEESYVTDSCLEEEEEEDEVHDEAFDENSLAFERDLDKVSSSSTYDHQEHVIKDDIMYKIELFDELQNEMAETKSHNDRLQQILTDRDRELSVSSAAIKQLQMERESLKRQLDDLQSTLEYEEAKMDRNGSSSGRSSNERRSLRRKKSTRGRPPMSPTSPEPESKPLTDTDRSSIDRNNRHHANDDKQEVELQLAKANSQIDHLRSQNDVLELTLDDAKNTSEKLSMYLARQESNGTALQLALAYSDQTIEAYDVLVALLETEISAIQGNKDDFDLKRAQANRRSALSVARHLIGRYDKTFRADSGIGGVASDHHGSSWEADSSGYSHTTSSTTSTNSSCQLDGSAGLHVASAATDFVHKSEEMRLREHICQLKTIQATIQGTVVDLEPFHNSSSKANKNHHQMNRSQDQEQLETAVLKQELMAAKEEIADLKAKIYVSDKEKSGLELTVEERRMVETMLRTHVHHLQEQLQHSTSQQGGGSSGKKSASKTEDLLRQRIENLLDTLDNVVKTSDLRNNESKELIDDLKKANSTLSEALDKTKRKHQSKIKRLEQQLMTVHK